MAATLGAVGHPEGRAVVAGAEHAPLASDHRPDASTQAVGAGARRQGDQQEVLDLVRAWRQRPAVSGIAHTDYGGIAGRVAGVGG